MDGNCQNILRMLGESLEERGDKEWCRKLEAHLSSCPRCRIVVDSTRKTIQFHRDNEVPCIPPLFERHLHDMLKLCWDAKTKSVD